MAWRNRKRMMIAGVSGMMFAGLFALQGQEQQPSEAPPPPLDFNTVEHPECVFFGPKHADFVKAGLSAPQQLPAAALLTQQVMAFLSAPAPNEASNETTSTIVIPGGSRTNAYQHSNAQNTIDKYIFAAIRDAGIAPASKSSDWEFIRRVTLDLTGRIPTPDRVLTFVADSSYDKRAKLVDELLAKPEWVDKWTMYYGDLFKVSSRNNTTGVIRYGDGRDAFYNWLKQQLSSKRPYNEIAADLISSTGTNSYDPTQGQINWLVNGLVVNGPIQDAYDQEAANISETFLGISHLNCTLCHNGRGHLDALSVWGQQELRTTSWGLSAFLAKTRIRNTPVAMAVNNQPYYWSVADAPTMPDYQLNTLTGNRPARCKDNQPPTTDSKGNPVCAATGSAAPVYPFNGHTPRPGEPYRVALAREVTSDFQFARAAVNYVWKEFFGMGIVDPTNQFDVARLDPDNPPPAPWTLQPSNARLLNALAQDFINSGYDVRALMREIATSDAYQLSARYAGTPPAPTLFARKMVRRLWGEEVHDAIAQSSGIIPSYNIDATIGRVSWAMQLPEPVNLPGGTVTTFLDAFLRGNRDDEERRQDGSLSQALDLMDDSFVMTRIRAAGSGANATLLAKSLPMTDDQLVNNLFLNVLSRYPTDDEKSKALSSLASAQNTSIRQQKAENLLWSLYNKVDFIFNY